MAEAAPHSSRLEPSLDIDKLSYEIFSILESRFLFGFDSDLSHSLSAVSTLKPPRSPAGKVFILSIDAGGATRGLLSAKSLALLESSLSRRSGNPDARIADFFDVAAGSGAGGLLTALLFTRGPDGLPLSASDALRLLYPPAPTSRGALRRLFRRRGAENETARSLREALSDCALRDTVKTVLIPCYDVGSSAPFVFSRADAVEMDGCDFRMRDVCAATMGDRTVEIRSVDGRRRIVAVEGGVAMGNPTAAAITHVLNNKGEFPFCAGVEDVAVVSLGNGEGAPVARSRPPVAGEVVRIAGDVISDVVDQAVAMAFGRYRASNYVRIQANGSSVRKFHKAQCSSSSKWKKASMLADEMLRQKNVESVLFQGRKIAEETNAQKLDWFAGELLKEQQRRMSCVFPTVLLKQVTPRTSTTTVCDYD